ncbi:MAG: DUF4124 domain-containing protein [Gammaproteobacteria bacterium]
MKWYSVMRYVVAFVLCIAVSSNAAAAVFKCVDKSGKTGYQARPCDDLDKSDLIEIENFDKPASVSSNKSEAGESSSGKEAKSGAEKRKEQDLAACKELKKVYRKEIRQAKAADKARIKAIKDQCNRDRNTYCGKSTSGIQAQNQYKRDKRAFNKYVKNKKSRKKSRKKSSSRSGYRSVSDTENVDRVKSKYKSEKKRLRCT